MLKNINGNGKFAKENMWTEMGFIIVHEKDTNAYITTELSVNILIIFIIFSAQSWNVSIAMRLSNLSYRTLVTNGICLQAPLVMNSLHSSTKHTSSETQSILLYTLSGPCRM